MNDGMSEWVNVRIWQFYHPSGFKVGIIATLLAQYQATGYYACIERLFVRGIPLYENEKHSNSNYRGRRRSSSNSNSSVYSSSDEED